MPGPGDQQAPGVLQNRFDGPVGLTAVGSRSHLAGALPAQRGEHRRVHPVQRRIRQGEQDVVLGYYSLPRRRFMTSNSGGPSPEKNNNARSRRSQLPSRKARAPAQNSSAVSVSPASRSRATAWRAASSRVRWCHARGPGRARSCRRSGGTGCPRSSRGSLYHVGDARLGVAPLGEDLAGRIEQHAPRLRRASPLPRPARLLIAPLRLSRRLLLIAPSPIRTPVP